MLLEMVGNQFLLSQVIFSIVAQYVFSFHKILEKLRNPAVIVDIPIRFFLQLRDFLLIPGKILHTNRPHPGFLRSDQCMDRILEHHCFVRMDIHLLQDMGKALGLVFAPPDFGAGIQPIKILKDVQPFAG